MSQSLSPIPPPLHLHQSTIPRCDSLISYTISPSAHILVACAPHCIVTGARGGLREVLRITGD